MVVYEQNDMNLNVKGVIMAVLGSMDFDPCVSLCLLVQKVCLLVRSVQMFPAK